MEDGQTIYDYAYHKVEAGADFKVDFIRRRVEVDGEVLIDNGKYEGELGVPMCAKFSDVLYDICDLYELYKRSTPTERSERKKHTYFYALTSDEIIKEYGWLLGCNRDIVQFHLEFMFLGYVLTGQLTWQPEWTGYYWRPSKESTLRIQKEWIIPNQ